MRQENTGIPKAERKSAIALVILTLLYLFSGRITDCFIPENIPPGDEELLITFEEIIKEKSQHKFENEKDNYQSRKKFEKNYSHNFEPKKRSAFKLNINCTSFNPNTISADSLTGMGIPEKIAKNIFNYRKAGGHFYHKHDLLIIYSLDSVLYRALADCIEIPAREKQANKYQYRDESKLVEPMELNSATEEQLRSLPGIGEVLSKRIVSFRNLLGGFHSVEQIQETYGMDEENYQKAAPLLYIREGVKCIDLNSISAFELKRHPYSDGKMAGQIIAYRKQHGNFDTTADLDEIIGIDEEKLSKLKPYLCLNEEMSMPAAEKEVRQNGN